MEYATQMDAARKGIVTKEMEIVPSGQLIDKITTYDEYLASDEMARKRQGFAEAASDDED